jgi:hypothetical protein
MSNYLLERYKACMILSGVGDALGYMNKILMKNNKFFLLGIEMEYGNLIVVEKIFIENYMKTLIRLKIFVLNVCIHLYCLLL